MKQVKNFASFPVVTALESDTVEKIAQTMNERHVGNVVVVSLTDEGFRPVGIVTDRDIVVLCVATNRIPSTVTAVEIMSEDLVVAHEEDGVSGVLTLMKENAIRRIPLVDRQGVLKGIVAMDDLISVQGKELDDLPRLQRNWEKVARGPTP